MTARAPRTQNVFERIGEQRLGSTIDLAPLSSVDARRRYGVASGRLAGLVFRAGLELAGFGRFTRMPTHELEELLDTTDIRDFTAPLALSATLVLSDDPLAASLIDRAASLVLATRAYRDDVFAGRVDQDFAGDRPLEMGLYPNMFATALHLHDGRLVLRKHPDRDRVGVLCRGHAFVLDFDRRTVGIAALRRALQRIVDDTAAAHQPDPMPAVVTAAAPESGAIDSLARLSATPVNRQSIDELEQCSFVLALEPDTRPADLAEAAYQCHVGNIDNRWFMSTLQLVVFEGGTASALCNFRAWLDGNAMVRGVANIQTRGRQLTETGLDDEPSDSAPTPERLSWDLSGVDLAEARADVARRTSTDVPFSVVLTGIGRDQLGASSLAAADVFTVALAVAAHRLSGRVPSIHQAVTMADRRGVGVEFAPVTTPETERIVAAIANAPRRADLAALLVAAVQSQRREVAAVRAQLQFETQLHYFHLGKHRYLHRWSAQAERATVRTLRLLGAWQRQPADIRISHPTIRSEVSFLGRPGARMHQTEMFALHYQIAADSIMLTVAPGLEWSVPNAELWTTLEGALHDIARIVAEIA